MADLYPQQPHSFSQSAHPASEGNILACIPCMQTSTLFSKKKVTKSGKCSIVVTS